MPEPLTDTAQRLQSLRGRMRERGWQAVLVPTSDPHLSEYLPDHWQGRQWLSGFTGSSGTLVNLALHNSNILGMATLYGSQFWLSQDFSSLELTSSRRREHLEQVHCRVQTGQWSMGRIVGFAGSSSLQLKLSRDCFVHGFVPWNDDM